MFTLETVGGLRCFVCGGHSGTPCRGGVGWAQDNTNTHHHQETDMAGQDPVQECTDLINNRGCVKQFVNGGNIMGLLSTNRDLNPKGLEIAQGGKAGKQRRH